jgi:hypothetical protein
MGHMIPGGTGYEYLKKVNKFIERIACRNLIPSGVAQGKLYDNAVSGDSRTASLSGGRISSFQGGVLQSQQIEELVTGLST